MASDVPLHIRITHQSKALGTAVVDVPSSVVPSEPADEITALRARIAELEGEVAEMKAEDHEMRDMLMWCKRRLPLIHQEALNRDAVYRRMFDGASNA